MAENQIKTLTPDNISFLSKLWSGEGRVFVGQGVKSTLLRKKESVLTKLEATEQHTGKNTFFCPSIYSEAPESTRAKKNVTSVGGLWIDCDFKDYDSNEEAIKKLRVLTDKIGPTATFFTGGGLHLYWLFTEAIPVDQWMPVARQWKSYVMGLDATRDPKTLANPATLMRLPGAWTEKRQQWVTGNYDPKKIYNFEDIRNFLGAPAPTTEAPSMLPDTPAYAAGETILPAASEWKLVDSELVENNCLMCQEFRACGGRVIEPQWFSFAGLAKFFNDGDAWFHDISSGDPRYIQSQTQDYLDRSRADRESPTPCEELMEGWGQNPDTNPCNKCHLKGQIRSPWDIPTRVHQPVDDMPESIAIPVRQTSIPPGYRTDEGGVIHKYSPAKKEGEQPVYEAIYDRPLRPIAIVYDELSETRRLFFTAKLGRAGWVEASLDLAGIHRNNLAVEMANQGVLLHPDQGATKKFNQYVYKQYSHMQDNTDEHVLHKTMGWTGGLEGFTCGDILYRPNKDATSFVLSRDLLKQQKDNNIHYEIQGDVASWQKTVDEVVGHPGLRDRRAVLAMGFGTPLVALTSYASAVVSMWGESGCGKSGVLRLISSIYGFPTDSHLTQSDTDFGAAKILASIGALPVCYDEITNMNVDEMKNMVFQVSRGRTKNAGTKDGGTRAVDTWRTMMFTTANSSLYDMLLKDHTSEAGGEIYRTMEVAVKPLEHYGIKHNGSVDTHIIKGSYGVAGEIWLQYVVDNKSALEKSMAEVAKAIVAKVGDRSPERFWTGLIGASAVVSASTCKKLGIYDFDVKEIFDTVCEMILTARKHITGNKMTPLTLLEQYLRDNIQNTIIVSDENARGVEVPRNTVTVRIEADSLVFLSRAEFMAWIKDKRQNFEDFLDYLDKEGYLVERNKQKRLLAGTGLKSGGTRCVVIKAEKLEAKNERAA